MAEPELMKENEGRTGTERELTDEEKREMMIDLVFNGDRDQFNEFCDIVYEALPEDTYAVIRGSSITNERYDDGAPFDASGPGTSDVDLTLVGPNALSFYILDGYYLPGVHTKPLSDKDPDIAPDLVPLRERLTKLVGRPVNIQATRDFFTYVREYWLGQPHLTICAKEASS